MNADIIPQTSKRARKSPHNWIGQKEKRRERKKGIRMGTAPLGVCYKRGEVSIHLEAPLLVRSTRTEVGGFKASEKSVAASTRSLKQRDAQLVLPSSASQPEMLIYLVGWVWGLRLRIWRSDSGKGLGSRALLTQPPQPSQTSEVGMAQGCWGSPPLPPRTHAPALHAGTTHCPIS